MCIAGISGMNVPVVHAAAYRLINPMTSTFCFPPMKPCRLNRELVCDRMLVVFIRQPKNKQLQEALIRPPQ